MLAIQKKMIVMSRAGFNVRILFFPKNQIISKNINFSPKLPYNKIEIGLLPNSRLPVARQGFAWMGAFGVIR